MCDHHIADDPTGLQCTRTDAHDPAARGGHIYITGSYVNDRHTDGGHG